MRDTRVALLVHDDPDGPEAHRAAQLSAGRSPEGTLVLHRTTTRSSTARTWARALARFQPSVIYVLKTASPGIPLALMSRVRRGTPFVVDTGDLVFEMARSSGVGAGVRLPALWLGEELAHRFARTIVVRSTTYADHLRARGRHNTAVIRDIAPEPLADPAEERARRRERLGLDGTFVVGVLGSLVFSPRLGFCYGWDLVRALALIDDPTVRGMVVGDGDGRRWLEQEASRLGVRDRIDFVGRVPMADALGWVSVFDVGLSTQTANLAGHVRTTGKLPIYMSAGCFVLASAVGEARRVLPPEMLIDYVGARDD